MTFVAASVVTAGWWKERERENKKRFRGEMRESVIGDNTDWFLFWNFGNSNEMNKFERRNQSSVFFVVAFLFVFFFLLELKFILVNKYYNDIFFVVFVLLLDFCFDSGMIYWVPKYNIFFWFFVFFLFLF